MTTFHPLTTDMPKPKRFTYPFHYTPHPLAVMAAEEVKRAVAANAEWLAEAEKGKMFGVLVVETADGLAFLAAYSGLFCGRNDWDYFVPPVYDLLNPDGYFKQEEEEITAINHHISALESSFDRMQALASLDEIKRHTAAEEADFRTLMAVSKAERDRRRLEMGSDDEALIRESQYQKAELRRMKKRNAEAIAVAEERLRIIDAPIASLKAQRRKRSEALQTWLFSQFDMLNARGRRRNLCSIFADTPQRIPPSGAGECCAPKLLQYAYVHGLRPVCMAEFWWGASPKSEVRHHWQYYPSCRGKCLPILTHMLQGLDVDPDPLSLTGKPLSLAEEHFSRSENAETNDGADRRSAEIDLKVLYVDDDVIVVDKPSGMLSVPGRSGQPSVVSILSESYGEIFSVHRLDMDTSGLIVYARHAAAHKALQAQFLARTVKKKYHAVVVLPPDGLNVENSTLNPFRGTIRLPLRPDPLDRPRQVVDHDHGKPAVTEWRTERIIERSELPSETVKDYPADTTIALLSLIPHTGRTHQLRVHCAHAEGLNSPILGDRLYGFGNDVLKGLEKRLFLHAASLAFIHPTTGAPMTFTSEWLFH